MKLVFYVDYVLYLDYMVVNIYNIHVNIVHFNLKIHQ